MIKNLKSYIIFVVLGLCLRAGLALPQAQALTIRPYDGLVNDFAQVLSTEKQQQLETQLLKEAEKENGVELMILTLKSLEGEVIESAALAYFDDWGIGKKRVDNGALLLLAIEDREVRIQTGYGLEGVLPDGLAGRIIDQEMIPHLRNDDYDRAIQAGVNKILEIVANPEAAQTYSSSSSAGDSIFTILLILFIFIGIIALFLYLIAKHAPKTPSSTSSSSSRSTFPARSSSSSSSSSRSFRTGGGRTGGGGASRKW